MMNKIGFVGILLFLLMLAGCGGGSNSDQRAGESGDDSEESIVENAVFTDLDGNEVSVGMRVNLC